MSLPLQHSLQFTKEYPLTTNELHSSFRNLDDAFYEDDARVLTLAKQIIAAIPERIKNESQETLLENNAGYLNSLKSEDTVSDVLMDPLLEHSAPGLESTEINIKFTDQKYRYHDASTPQSSLSPTSSSCLPSPCSFTIDSSSPPPTTDDFSKFFQASETVIENDFSNLTLSDREQRELYEAAKVIQKAYRSYKGRLQQEQDKEHSAAIIIQNYYRRYKQYSYFKQMTHAAKVIQNGFRSYCENKRGKTNQETSMFIDNYYRNYNENEERDTQNLTLAMNLK